ncbi:MAG: FeoA family protein [Planctomycetaceae bacterium]
MSTLRLADLNPGESATVTDICGDLRISARLMELGFIPGSVVTVLRRAPFGGPVQYRIRGVSVSMRPADASSICVEMRRVANLAIAGSRTALELVAH